METMTGIKGISNGYKEKIKILFFKNHQKLAVLKRLEQL